MNREELISGMKAAAKQTLHKVTLQGIGDVYTRELTVAEVETEKELAALFEDGQTDKRPIARGACKLICDESGVLLLDPQNEEDVALVASLPWRVLGDFFKEHQKQNAISEEGVNEAKNV